MIAAREGDEARVLMYLDQGRDVNEEKGSGRTAFFYAVDRGHYNIARLLISRGANPKLQPDQQVNMIWSVAERGDDEFLVYLLEQVGIDFPCLDVLRAFAGYCQVEEIETLLRAMGDSAPWGVDEIRRFAQMETDCSEEIGLLVEKYGKE